MHLRVLKFDEKKALIDLAFHLFNLDLDFNDKEKSFLNLYLRETMLDIEDYKPHKKSLQNTLQSLKESSFIVKKAIFLELSFLIYNDHTPTDKENKFFDLLKTEWGIDEQIYRESITQAKEISDLQKKTNEFILEQASNLS